MEFQRKQFDIVLERIKEPRGKIQVVIGPRQVGKSTLMDQVLEQCPIPYTLANYLDVLGQCQLVCGLQKYANDDARKYNSSPKYQVFNNALLTANHRGKFETVRTDADLWGRWVESAIGAHLLSAAEEADYQVFYWCERDDEVDFIVATDDGFVAFEVKSGRRKMSSGMKEFVKAFKPLHSYIIGTGGISFEDFLQTDVTDWL